jgi:hypothetical protein
MSERTERNEQGIDSLRSQMDADARFHRALSGYDPQDVRRYVENVKRIFAQQTKAAKQEHEYLIIQLDAAKSEIQARNYGIKKLKDLLVDRETQLNAANTRISALLQAVKNHSAERDELERLRLELAEGGNAERIRALEAETQKLRASVAQASNLVVAWKAERERLMAENDRLREEVYYLRAVTTRPAVDASVMRPFETQSAYATTFERPPIQQPMQQPMRQSVQQPMQPPMQQPMQQTTQQAAFAQQKEFSQVADKLATMFAEAYQLISQFKSKLDAQPDFQQQRPMQPAMQILRPDTASGDAYYPRK